MVPPCAQQSLNELLPNILVSITIIMVAVVDRGVNQILIIRPPLNIMLWAAEFRPIERLQMTLGRLTLRR